MTNHVLTRFLHTLRRATPLPDAGDSPDGQLLARFVAGRDEAAFAALVRRHGPMVYGVCRRVLGCPHDAEDAFQAAFLVLVRKARSVLKYGSVGGWLHGAAYRTALQARAGRARREARERQVTEFPEPAAMPTEPQDWRPLLDRELRRLPEHYRAAVVLCDLEGRPRKEAARRLGVPEGTLSSRLAAARRMLAGRLARRGLALSGGALAASVSGGAARAAVPPVLTSSTIRAAALAAGGKLGAAPAAAASLAKGVVRAMWMTKLKAAAAVLAVIAAVGAGGLVYHGASMPAARAADGGAAPSDAEALRKENELLKLNLQVVLEKLRAQEAKRDDSDPEHDEAARRFADIAGRFKYRVPVEVGATEFKDDARIEIVEVWGTQPKIVVGGQYIVRGKYVLPAHERGTLYFYRTSTGSDGFGPNMDLQQTAVAKGKGEFTLLHAMGGPGYLHLELFGEYGDKSDAVADVYFGTGDNVLKKKSWKLAPGGEPARPVESPRP
jgi:RNA polymerase sigma factor (sigma-70 family)